MYKTLTVAALLLAAFAFTSGSRSADASPTTSIGPTIVARGKLVNQTAPIPTTTIFTPTHTGLYRLSVYATVTQNTPPTIQDNFFYYLYWTDDAGAEQSSAWGLTWNSADSVPPFAPGVNSGIGTGDVTTFEAVGGTTVSYSVTGAVDGSAFSLYYTVERLE
jgi:hypothetical protein